jgi:hypothetical protein
MKSKTQMVVRNELDKLRMVFEQTLWAIFILNKAF